MLLALLGLSGRRVRSAANFVLFDRLPESAHGRSAKLGISRTAAWHNLPTLPTEPYSFPCVTYRRTAVPPYRPTALPPYRPSAPLILSNTAYHIARVSFPVLVFC